MHIVCSSCNAAYDVPPEKLRPGQAVRCARCAHQWVPLPDPAPVRAEPRTLAHVPVHRPIVPVRPAGITPRPPIDLPPPPVTRPFAPPPARNPWLGWVVLLLVLVLLAAAAYAWRVQIIAAWPPSVRLYNALGLNRPAL